MKHLLVILMMAAAFSAFADEWKNALAPKGSKTDELTFVEDGKAKAVIIIPTEANSMEKKAGEDLQYWLKQMTGAHVGVKFDLKVKPKGSMIISIGRTKLAQDALLPDVDLKEDGYSINEVDGNLFLRGGRARGIVNAVYALLEEDIGCRWYDNGEPKLPKGPTLKAAVAPRTYVPQLRLRDPFYLVSFDPVWSLRNRTSAPDAKVPEEFGGRIDYDGYFVHTAANLVPAAKYFKDHPEYYFLDKSGKRNPAQLCATNPEVAKIVIESVRKTLKEHPETEIISVSKNDSGGDQLCQCDNCKKVREAEGGAEMGVQLVLVNKVAEAIEKDYPNVTIDTLAYLDTIGVPKTARPRKNVAIRFCNDVPGAWSHPFTPAENCPVAAIAKAWSAACDRIYVWDYNVNFSHYLAPMPNMDVIAKNIKFWVANHAEGVMTQGGYSGVTERDWMRSWVIAKLMWDPSLDQQALVDDFIYGYYGKAAPAMAEYDALLRKAGEDHAKELASPPGGIRYPMTTAFLTKDFLDSATKLMAKAHELAGDDAALQKKLDRAELSILYVKAMRGPEFVGETYGSVIDRFEKLAREAGVNNLEEVGPTLDARLAEWRKKSPAKPQAAAPANAPFKVISKGPEAMSYQAFPDACRLKNGDIVAVFYAGYGHVSLAADDCPNGGRICMVRSSDEGKTWTAPQVLFDDPDDNRDPHIAQLDDGSLICTFFSWSSTKPPLKSSKEFTWDYFNKVKRLSGAQMVRSTDGGKTWEKQATTLQKGWVCSAPVRQLSDGTCILGLYGERTGASIRSTDHGKTWDAPAVMKAPPGVSLDAETDIIQLKDGTLFAALRQSKNDMYFSTSTDQGKTWADAKDIGFPGHCPHLNRLSSGEIILCHRVPNTSIHISRDECKTWQGPIEIDNCIGAYPATVELKDHTVLIVYYSEGNGSEIRAQRFKLANNGIEKLPL
jgi:hypothetical protein